MSESMDIDVMRRFGGVRRLYGEQGLQRFQAAHVCVVGVGGVGSWAVEALARNAIGRLTLIDLDNIAESNVNRQLHAVEGEFGKAKVTAMAERIRLINPLAQVQEIEEFVTVDNVDLMLNRGYDVVLDAIDDARAKVAMAAWCRQHKVPLVMAGGAGGRFDPTRIRIADLVEVHGDRLLAKVRNNLRRDHGFPKASQSQKKPAKFGIQCIYSDEPVQLPDASCEVSDDSGVTGLNCAGYGSSVAVTAPSGMAAAAVVLKLLTSAAR
ncbi:tRNA threonylcarbamoyladenosine dehydratase [Methylobacillus gramineus]|uniref:tRNA threonylcarbamoyladenosine dehydratase n=1 Tax=Methylobacillus gramineus TaxID=755169 RepID=UPI00384E6897